MNTFSNFQSNAQTYIAAKTLSRINRDVVVYGLGKKEKLPNRFSKTFQFTRYEKLALPKQALTEGVSPLSGADMSVSTVQAVMDQWGSYVALSDVATITAKHPAVEAAIELLAEQAKETIDRECIELLLSNTSVRYAGSASSRATLTASDYLTTNTAKKAIAALRKNGAMPATGRLFQGLIDPSVEMDLLEDSTFQNAASYSNIMALNNGEAGIWMGVRFLVSNLIPTMSRLADVTTASAAGGSLAPATTHYVKVVAVDDQLGFEVSATQVQTQATAGGQGTINVTVPSDIGYSYNVYVGTSAVNLVLHTAHAAAGAVVAVASLSASTVTPPAHPGVGVNVHFAWILGKEAFAVPELMSLQTTVTPATASDSDPLAQRRKMGWKVMFKPVICNEKFIERIECASRY